MIAIIGAGPAGCYAAYLLAKAGKQVHIFEEHSSVGRPVQCTGIVTSSASRFVDIKKGFVINKIKKARIYSPDKKFVEVRLKKPNIIIDREKFDRYLAKKAVSAGAKLSLNSRFVGIKGSSILLRQKNMVKSISPSCIIGADGPLSPVAKSAGIFGKRCFLTGVQARARLENDNAVEFFPFAGGFAWSVPENENIARIGAAARKDIAKLFNSLKKQKKLDGRKIIEKQAGLIPIYNKCKIQKGNIFLLGDAALHVKATTGGGIVQGLTAAKALADSIITNQPYKKLLKNLNFELWIHKKARTVLDKFSKKEYNNLVEIFNKPKNKRVLENTDRDNISLIALKLLLSEPQLLKYSRYML